MRKPIERCRLSFSKDLIYIVTGFLMSDNIRRYASVRTVLAKAFPGAGKRQHRHLNTLAAMITGIVASGSTHLSKVAQKAPDHAKNESRVKRMSRFIQNKASTQSVFFMPLIRELLAAMNQPLLIVFDASAIGRGCTTLMASLVYDKRALPLAWMVKKGKKGHFSAEDHVKLLRRLSAIIPGDAQVIFLGDGEFDSIELQRALEAMEYFYVCRTACSTLLDDGFTCCPVRDLMVERSYLSMPGALFTQAGYGPVHVIAYHEAPHKDPIYLVSNLELAQEAIHYYRHRFRIETFFSDQKSRGFHVHKSHVSDPDRLDRLMIAACLGYIWIIYLGVKSIERGWYKQFHRTDRIDLSLFQLGLRTLELLLNRGEEILVAFKVPPLNQSVR